MASQTVFVISDLHIGIGDKFDIFRNVGKVEAFQKFTSYAGQQPGPVELVINGDLVDFLQVKPWDDLRPKTALTKIKAIVENNGPVFHALGQFLATGTNQITVLLGNHDVELVFTDVWNVVRDRILEAAPNAANRLVMRDERNTYRFPVNGVMIHVEHGNYDDEWNSVNYRSLINAKEVGTPIVYPPGTKMVYETMNKLKEELQFVDVLKPELPSVILLLLALKPSSIEGLPGVAKEKLRAIASGFVHKLQDMLSGRMLATFPDTSAPPELALGKQLAESLADSPLTEQEVADIESFLTPPSAEAREMQASFGGLVESVKLRLLDWALHALVRFHMVSTTSADIANADYPDEAFAAYASKRFEGNIQAVIFGHTHEALKTEFAENQIYVNSGTWADIVRLPSPNATVEDRLRWLESIRDNEFERTARPTFVRIDASKNGAFVGLYYWESGPQKIWAKELTSQAAAS